MQVVATELGFYDGRRRKKGDTFTLRKGDKPGKWMRPTEPKKTAAKPEVAAPPADSGDANDELA